MKYEDLLLLCREYSLTTSPFDPTLPMPVEGGMLKWFAAAGTLEPFNTCSTARRIHSSLVPAVVAAEVDAIAASIRLSWSPPPPELLI